MKLWQKFVGQISTLWKGSWLLIAKGAFDFSNICCSSKCFGILVTSTKTFSCKIFDISWHFEMIAIQSILKNQDFPYY